MDITSNTQPEDKKEEQNKFFEELFAIRYLPTGEYIKRVVKPGGNIENEDDIELHLFSMAHYKALSEAEQMELSHAIFLIHKSKQFLFYNMVAAGEISLDDIGVTLKEDDIEFVNINLGLTMPGEIEED